jgi:filamentous hemagglutinin family protein
MQTNITGQGTKNLTVTGGVQRSQNLFHSFREFNVKDDESVYFDRPEDKVSNIIARVTGTHDSYLGGKVSSQAPNFYLINPNGVLFGANVQINVSGTFHVSTANEIRFTDRSVYGVAVNGNGSSDLTSVSPSSFGFVGDRPGNQNPNVNSLVSFGDESTSTASHVASDGNVIVVAGGVSINNGSQVSAVGKAVDIVTVDASRSGTVAISPGSAPRSALGGKIAVSGDSHVVANQVSLRGGDIVITAASPVQPSVQGTNSVNVEAGNVTVSGGGIASSATTGANGISVTATGTVTLDKGGRLASSGSAIDVHARDVVINNSESAVETGISSSRAGASIKVTATNSATLSNAVTPVAAVGVDPATTHGIVADSAGQAVISGAKLNAPTVRANGMKLRLAHSGDSGASGIGVGSENGGEVAIRNTDVEADSVDLSSSHSARVDNATLKTAALNADNSPSLSVINGGVVRERTGDSGLTVVAKDLSISNGKIMTSQSGRPLQVNVSKLSISHGSSPGYSGIAVGNPSDNNGHAVIKGGSVAATGSVSLNSTTGADIDDEAQVSAASLDSTGTPNLTVAGGSHVVASSVKAKQLTVDGSNLTDGKYSGFKVSGTDDTTVASHGKAVIHQTTVDAEKVTFKTTGPTGKSAVVASTLAVDEVDGLGTSGLTLDQSTVSNRNGHDLSVSAGSLNLKNLSHIKTSDGRSVTINGATSRGSVDLAGGSTIATDNSNSAGNRAGDVSVYASDIKVGADGSHVSSDTTDTGASGDVLVDTQGNLTVSENQSIHTNAAGNGADSGKLTLRAANLTVANGVALKSEKAAGTTGKSGDVELAVSDQLTLGTGASVVSSADLGNSGKVTVSASRVALPADAKIQSTSAKGTAGDVSVTVTGSDLVVKGKDQIASVTEAGQAGKVTVDVGSGKLSLSETGRVASVGGASGKGGDVEIHAGNLELDGANGTVEIASVGSNPSKVGNVTLDVKNDLTLKAATGGSPLADGMARVGVAAGNAGEATLYGGEAGSGKSLTASVGRSVAVSGPALSGTGQLAVTNQAGSDLSVDAVGTRVSLQNGAAITTNGQKLTVNAQEIELQNAKLAGLGNGGSVEVAANNLTIRSSGANSSSGITSERGTVTATVGNRTSLVGAGSGSGNRSFYDAGIVADSEGTLIKNSELSTASLDASGSSATISDRSAVHASSVNFQTPVASVTSGSTVDNGSTKGNLTVTAQDALTLSGGGRIEVVDGGSLAVTAPNLTLSNGDIRSSNAGTLDVTASEKLTMTRGSTLGSVVDQAGKSGEKVRVRAGDIRIDDGSRIASRTSGAAGDASDLVVNAGSLSIAGNGIRRSTGIMTAAGAGSQGLTGRVDVHVRGSGRLAISNQGEISSSNGGDGTGTAAAPVGNAPATGTARGSAKGVNVSGGNIVLNNGLIYTSTANRVSGANLTVNAETLTETANGKIFTETTGPARGGDVTVKVAGALSINGTQPGIFTKSAGGGKAGNVFVNYGRFIGSPQLAPGPFLDFGAIRGNPPFFSGAGDINLIGDKVCINDVCSNDVATRLIFQPPNVQVPKFDTSFATQDYCGVSPGSSLTMSGGGVPNKRKSSPNGR